MNVVKKALIAAIGLIITVGLCYAAITIFEKATDTVDKITDNQNETAKAIQEYAVTQYDGYDISGATAISYIKTVLSDYGLLVEVTTTKGSFTCTDSTDVKEFRNINSSYYINPMTQYHVTVVRDDNDMLEKVIIQYIP